jgi:pimeloyl-ACP methyl ester carboxylesterase
MVASTFVLVPGGAHGGWCYQRVARRLQASGHLVHAVTLTGVGERAHLVNPQVDLNTHIQDVVNVLVYEDLHDVVLVGHSYGGMVITGVADRVPDRIGKIVYLDAANPVDGQSLVDVSPDVAKARELASTVNDTEVVLAPFPGLTEFLYGVSDPDDVAWMDARLTGHPWKCFDTKLELHDPARLAAIPQFHIVCSSTVATRDPELIGAAKATGRFWEIDTGHDLMITESAWVADTLEQVARA